MFERFSDGARRALVLAQEQSRLRGHNFIGTEHLLLGLVADSEMVAARALGAIGISATDVRAAVEDEIEPSIGTPVGSPQFTPRARKVLELSLREALQFGHDYIGSEHLLIALVREGDGIGAAVLKGLGANLDRLRGEVSELAAQGVRDATSTAAAIDVAPRARTAAERRLRRNAVRLAGDDRVATNHVLRAMFDDERSLAARTLAELGLTRAVVEAKIAEIQLSEDFDEDGDDPSG